MALRRFGRSQALPLNWTAMGHNPCSFFPW